MPESVPATLSAWERARTRGPDRALAMLTLDTLARMATRMPSEPGASPSDPPYRRPDPMRVRQVSLPTVRDETWRALRLFAFGVTIAVVTMTLTGVIATHVGQVAEGAALDTGLLLRTALWYAGWTLLFVAPPTAWALWREVRRFRAIREFVGPLALVDAAARIKAREGDGPWLSLRSETLS